LLNPGERCEREGDTPGTGATSRAIRRAGHPVETRGSSDKQAKAKVRHFEIEEVAVAFDPPTGCEVST